MAEMTHQAWAAAVAAQAVTDGCNAGPTGKGHYRIAFTMRNQVGTVVLQGVHDLREGGNTHGTNGVNNPLP